MHAITAVQPPDLQIRNCSQLGSSYYPNGSCWFRVDEKYTTNQQSILLVLFEKSEAQGIKYTLSFPT